MEKNPVQKNVLKRKDFLELNKEAYFSGQAIHINYRSTKKSTFRLGITVTKKWANAVGRNLFKRRIKNSLNAQKPLPPNLDIQVKPKKGKTASYMQIQEDFKTFFNKNLVHDNI